MALMDLVVNINLFFAIDEKQPCDMILAFAFCVFDKLCADPHAVQSTSYVIVHLKT